MGTGNTGGGKRIDNFLSMLANKRLRLLLRGLVSGLLSRGQKYNQFCYQRPAITVAVAKYRHRLARP